MRPASLVPCALLVALAAAGCAGSDSSPSTTSTLHPEGATPSSSATTAPGAPTGDTTVEPKAEVLRFDGPTEIACSGGSVDVEVSYATRNVVAVGFTVDGASVSGPPAPTTGTYTVPVVCDDRVHTVMLIGSGAGGPVFATKAMATRPT